MFARPVSFLRWSRFVSAAALLLLSAAGAFAGQGAGRMLYVVPTNTFIEQRTGEVRATINDTSGSIDTVQAAINAVRNTNASIVIVIHLQKAATYSVTNAGLVLGSHECLVAEGATLKAASASVTVPLITIASGSTNVSIAGGLLDGNGANINGILAPAASRVNVDRVTVRNCGLDCILLKGNGNSTYDNEITVTRCEVSGSAAHAGISIQNSTQTVVLENHCHDNSSGIWLSCAWANVANNICHNNTTGIEVNGGNDNVVANNTCNNNGTGIKAGATKAMIVSNSLGGNSTAGIASTGTSNNFINNLFTAGNAVNFTSSGSANNIIAYKAALSASGQNYFYPPLIDDQHTNTIVNGLGRTDVTVGSGTLDSVQAAYNAALAANPNNAIVLHMNGTFTVGASSLTLSNNTCVLLNGTIQISAATTANTVIKASSQTRISISGGTLDGGNLNGHAGISGSSCSMMQVDGMTIQNFGDNSSHHSGSDSIHYSGGTTPYAVTRCNVIKSGARGIWAQTSGQKQLYADNYVSFTRAGIDCDSHTFGAVCIGNTCVSNTYGIWYEQGASHNTSIGNTVNYSDRYNLDAGNNAATPPTQWNSFICNTSLGSVGIVNAAVGTNTFTSYNHLFNNVVISGPINSQQVGSNNYYSQNYQLSGSLSTSGAEQFFNSADVDPNLQIQCGNSGLLAIVQGASTGSGAAIVTGSATGQDNDLWQFIPTEGGYYQVKNKHSGLVLAVNGASTSPGALIVQAAYTADSTYNDEWRVLSAGNALYNFVNRRSGLYLEATNTGANLQLTQQSANGNNSQQFNLTLNPPPTISSIADQNLLVNTDTGPLAFTVSGGSVAASNVILTATSSNPSLIATSNITFGGADANRTVTVTPALNQTGTATITLTVSDGSQSTSTSFKVNVSAFFLVASPTSQSLLPGTATNYTVTVTGPAGFSDTVTFAASGLPSGVTANFVPPSIAGNGSATLNIATASNSPPGNYTLSLIGTTASAAVTNTAGLTINSLVAAPGALVWNAGPAPASSNWSVALNWTNTTAGGTGAPGTASDVLFSNNGSVASSNVVNNVVDTDTTISSLQFAATNGFDTTLIGFGKTLTISGAKGLTAGTETDLGSIAMVNAFITGAGGTLVVSNNAANVVVRQFTGGSTGPNRATLDLSGLDTFNMTGNAVRAGVWDGTGTSRSAGTLYLARTNTLTLFARGQNVTTNAGIDVGDNPLANSSLSSFLYLGQMNTIYVDGITVGGGRQIGWMSFNPALANPSVTLRGTNGPASRVTRWLVGDNSGASNTGSNSRGTNDFTGGTIDALVNTMILGKGESPTMGSGSSTGVLLFDHGTIDANIVQLGVQASGSSGGTGAGTGGTNYTGIVNVNGAATLIVRSNLVLSSQAGGAGAYSLQGILNVNGGTVQATNILHGGGTVGLSTINLNSGTLDLQPTWAENAGTLQNISALNVGAAGTNDPAILANASTISAASAVNIRSNGVLAGNTTLTSPGLIINGAISPGNDAVVGRMTNNGPVTFAAGGHFAVDVQDVAAGPGIGWDFLQANGTIDIQGTSSNPFVIDLQSLDADGTGALAGFNEDTNYTWTIATASGGIANFSPTNVAVNSDPFENDLRGGCFFFGISGNSLVVSFTNNHAPAAMTAAFYRRGSSLAIPVSALAGFWSDPDNDPVALLDFADVSTNGATVSSDGTFIYITGLGDGPDGFTYTVQDVRTNPPAIYHVNDTVRTATGTVLIFPPPLISSAGLSGNDLLMSGVGGAPNGTYSVLSSTNLTLPPVSWDVLTNGVFDSSGQTVIPANVTGNSARFYLLKVP